MYGEVVALSKDVREALEETRPSKTIGHLILLVALCLGGCVRSGVDVVRAVKPRIGRRRILNVVLER